MTDLGHVPPFDLRTARLNRGLSRMELAKRCGVHRDSIRRIEEGAPYPRPQTLRKLAEFFGVTVSEIVAGREQPCEAA